MTDEALFYHRFVADVRSCAAGRAPACTAEIERRVSLALMAPPDARDQRWAQVVAAISALLVDVAESSGHAQRLRDFVSENADLWRGRDPAITDAFLGVRVESVFTTADGRRYLAYAPGAGAIALLPAPPRRRRIGVWSVYAVCAAAALTALWFAFVVSL